jgi:hypothetical protein
MATTTKALLARITTLENRLAGANAKATSTATTANNLAGQLSNSAFLATLNYQTAPSKAGAVGQGHMGSMSGTYVTVANGNTMINYINALTDWTGAMAGAFNAFYDKIYNTKIIGP